MIELKSNTSAAKSYIVPIPNNICLFSYLIRTHNTRLDFCAIHHRNSTLSLLCKSNGNIDVLPFPRANFNL